MLNWVGNDQPMKMRVISRAIGKKLSGNNYLGRALKFYASVRIDVRRTETVKESGEAVSNKVKVKVVKNKVAPPFKEAVVTIKFGKGLDIDSELLDISVENGEVVKSGSWFSLKSGERIGQGSENAKKYIEEHPELRQMLYERATQTSDDKIVGDAVPTADELKDQNSKHLELDVDIIDE